MTADQLRALLSLPHELAAVEAKTSGSLQTVEYVAKLARACIAMANQRNGGTILIGVTDQGETGRLEVVGVPPEDLSSWSPDNLMDKINRYARPPVQLTLDRIDIDGHMVLAISVQEFTDIPVICTTDHNGERNNAVLRRGAVYVRSSTKIQSVEPDDLTMRELMDLATEKRFRHLLRLLGRVGITIKDASDVTEEASRKLETSTPHKTWAAIQQRGWWSLGLTPVDGSLTIPLQDLETWVRAAVVQAAGGWYPCLAPVILCQRLPDAISWCVDAGPTKEAWIATVHGVVLGRVALVNDWWDESILVPPPEGWTPKSRFPIPSSIVQVGHLVEFLANCASSSVYDSVERVKVRAEFHGLSGRALETNDPAYLATTWALLGHGSVPIADVPFEADVARSEVISSHRSIAVRASKVVVEQFGWDASDPTLEAMLAR